MGELTDEKTLGEPASDGPQGDPSDRHDVFVSYSRRDRAFVEQLNDALVEHDKDVYVDWEDIPSWSPDWQAELYSAIDGADTFVLVLSPDSLASRNVKREVDRAIAQGKRIKPLLLRDVNDPEVPEEVKRPQWIDVRNPSGFDEAFAALLETLSTDVEWRRDHTRFLLRAKDWEQRDHDRSLLLGRSDLRDAEEWLAHQAGKEPPPTARQTNFVLASRRAMRQRQRILFSAVLVALAVATGLAIFALVQRSQAIANEERATRQARLATARRVAAQAELVRGEPDLALSSIWRPSMSPTSTRHATP